METQTATGTFDVKLLPLGADPTTEATPIGRLSLDKQFAGDLKATGRGVMLGVRTAVEASAGYVAMELVTGTLDGRTGTFVLQHSATMSRGAQQLSIAVVPDSGTEGFTGIHGTMQIIIDGKQHSYQFEYGFDA